MATSGCSSVMSHTGGYQGYYPGSRSDIAMIKSDDTSWVMTPLLAIDLPFTAVLDTLLLPYDYYRSKKNLANESTLERIRISEQHNLAISNGVDIDHVPPVNAN